jgi:transposase-like protein
MKSASMHWGNEGRVTGTHYSEKFRARMVEKMAGPQPLTALALAAETGVCQTTLSRWLREAITLRKKMAKRHDEEEQKLVAADGPQRTAEEKFSLVLEAATIAEAALGEWLRRKGVHAAQLEEWRTQAMAGIGGATKRSKDTAADARQIRQLERELARKDKALAEAAALLVLQKKVQAIWGDEDDDTDEKKDK